MSKSDFVSFGKFFKMVFLQTHFVPLHMANQENYKSVTRLKHVRIDGYMGSGQPAAHSGLKSHLDWPILWVKGAWSAGLGCGPTRLINLIF